MGFTVKSEIKLLKSPLILRVERKLNKLVILIGILMERNPTSPGLC